MSLRGLGIRVARIVALSLVTVAVCVVFFEKRLIYYPMTEHELRPEMLGLAYDDVRLEAADGVRLHGWWLPVPEARGTLLLAHGNAGNVSHRLERALMIQRRLGLSVLLFDYRGYGQSLGAPDEAGTYADARAAYRHLVETRGVPPERLVLMGESLGCAVALQLALEQPSRGLMLEAPFASIRAMAPRVIPILPIWPLLRTRYDNLAKVGGLRVPLLVLHGTADEIVPFEQGREVFSAAPEPKRFFPIPGAGHNTTYIIGGEPYWKAIGAWLDDLLPRSETGLTPAGPA